MNNSHYIKQGNSILYTFKGQKDKIQPVPIVAPPSFVLYNFITMGPTQSRYIVDHNLLTNPSLEYDDILFNSHLNMYDLHQLSPYGIDEEAVKLTRQGTAITNNDIAFQPGQKALLSLLPATTPGAPQSLLATPGNTQTSLSWSEPSNNGKATVTGYKVYQSTDDTNFTEVATPSGTSQTITGLTNGTTYYFKVAAVNSVGTGTETSSVYAVPSASATEPGVPQSLSGTRGDTQVALSWSAPSSNGGTAVTGYKVYQSTDDASFSEVATPSGTSHTVTGLTNGTTYYFKVAAVNSVGTGTQTSSVSAVPATTPAAPTSVSATNGNEESVISWTAPTNTGGAAITGYKIKCGATSGYPGNATVYHQTNTNTTYTKTGLSNGTQYSIQVAAVNAVGDGTYSTTENATPEGASTAPAQVGTVTPTAGNTQVDLSWSAPSNGGSSITDYVIEHSTDNASFTTFSDGTSTATTATVTGLTNGTQYYFRVSAVNAIGTGTASSSVTATPSASVTTPGVPTSVTGTNGDTQTVVSWTAPTDTGGSVITGYKIKCGETSGYPGNATTYHQTNTSTTYTKTGLTNGTQYSIQVAAVNAEGDGTYSSTVTATPAAASGGITPNTDSSARFYLPAAQTTFKVSCATSTGFFKIASPGKTDVITQAHTQYGTYYTYGGGNSATMSGLSSSAVKTVTVSSCTSGGTTSGNIQSIDIGSDSTNNITAVDISGLTSLSVFHAGAGGGSPAIDKFTGGPVGTRSMASSISEIRAVNVSFTDANGYTSPYGSTAYAAGNGFDLFNQDLDATALNQLYTDLNGGSGTGGVFVGQNPGTGSDNPSIASNYSIHGS